MWLITILSLLLTEFCFTSLLPLLLLLFWDLEWIFEMLSGWKGNELYNQVSTVVGEKLSWGYCSSIISSLLVVFCTLFLPGPSCTKGALKFYVQRAPLFIPTVDTLSLRKGSCQQPCSLALPWIRYHCLPVCLVQDESKRLSSATITCTAAGS